MFSIIQPKKWQLKPPRGLRVYADPGHWAYPHLVAFWPLNDGGRDGIIYDAGPNKIHGTIAGTSNTVAWNDRGIFTPHLDFSGDAVNDRVDLGVISTSNPLQLANDECTIVCSYLLNSGTVPAGNSPRIIDKSDAGTATNGWSLYTTASASNYFWTLAVNGGDVAWDETALVIQRDTVNHVAVTKSGGTLNYYMGQPNNVTQFGRIRFIQQQTGANAIPSAQTSAAIGNWNHSTDREWYGDIYWLMIFDRLFTFAEIQELTYRPYALLKQETPRTFYLPSAAPTPPSPGSGRPTLIIITT